MSATSPYRSLDHWRGFAALWVVGFHSFGPWLEASPGLLPALPGAFVKAGWLGVHVFFVISGYCIAARLAGDFTAGRKVTAFWLDRLWRIYPPYWATLLLAAGIAVAATPFNGLAVWSASPSGGALPAGIGDGLMVTAALEPWFGRPSYLLVAWTLTYEIAFYVLAGLGYLLARRTNQPALAFGCGGALALAGLLPITTAWIPVLELWTHFYLGITVWLLRSESMSLRFAAAGFLVIAGVVLALGHILGLAVAVGVAGLLILLHPIDDKICAQPVLRWLGKLGVISYALYLTHAPVVGRCRNLLGRFWPADQPGAWCVPAGAALLAVLVAWLFYCLVELPSEKRRQAHRRRGTASASSS